MFLDFISYSGGPLPEELLDGLGATGVPVSILWGREDPWEDVVEGKRLFAGYPCVEEFLELPGIGHCPQVRKSVGPGRWGGGGGIRRGQGKEFFFGGVFGVAWDRSLSPGEEKRGGGAGGGGYEMGIRRA